MGITVFYLTRVPLDPGHDRYVKKAINPITNAKIKLFTLWQKSNGYEKESFSRIFFYSYDIVEPCSQQAPFLVCFVRANVIEPSVLIFNNFLDLSSDPSHATRIITQLLEIDTVQSIFIVDWQRTFNSENWKTYYPHYTERFWNRPHRTPSSVSSRFKPPADIIHLAQSFREMDPPVSGKAILRELGISLDYLIKNADLDGKKRKGREFTPDEIQVVHEAWENALGEIQRMFNAYVYLEKEWPSPSLNSDIKSEQ